ncbi:MAG: RIP metalloprotease RseP [Planctomycetota bacterium]|nr:RIP metalloprotease RseP [Planctomycetota bacterium]
MNIILAILGIGFLIFVHELGHFLAAKFVGVRVDTFAVGFQPTIFGWRARLCAFTYGETEYVIGLVPLGGYVKMAGEEPGEPRTDSDDEFHKKPIPSRLLILVAGATMNLIFGFLLFILAFSVGVKQQSAVVGNATAMGPAWNAGVRSGDLITAVNGQFWSDYSNVATAIALSGGSQPVSLTIERDRNVIEVAIDPLWDAVAGRYRIGIQPAISDRIAFVMEGSVADDVGLQPGDQIKGIRVSVPSQDLLAVSATDITADRMLQSLSVLRSSTALGNLGLQIQREDELLVATIELSPIEDGTSREIGVYPRMRTVQAVQPGSQASGSFQVGEEIVSIGASGQPSSAIEALDLIAVGRIAEDRDIELTLTNRLGEKRHIGSEDLRRMLGEQLIIGSGVRTVVKAGEGMTRLKIPVGAELIRVGNQNIGAGDYIDEALPAGAVVHWFDPQKPDSVQSVIVAEELTLDVILGNPARIGRTLPGSPAYHSSLKAGSIIEEVNGIQVERWQDLSSAITGSEGPVAISFTDPSGTTNDVELEPVTLGQPLGIAMAADQFTEKLNVSDAVIQGGRQSWIWGGRIFLTLRALFAGDVHGKNLNGPVGIIDLGRKVSEVGFGNLFFLLALISINLGIFNLLPFPILDGGHIFFLTIEGIRGRPVPEKIQHYVHLVAFLLLISLALFVTYNDLLRLR